MKETFMMNFGYRDWNSVTTEDKGKTFTYWNSIDIIGGKLTEGYLYEKVYKYYKEKFLNQIG